MSNKVEEGLWMKSMDTFLVRPQTTKSRWSGSEILLKHWITDRNLENFNHNWKSVIWEELTLLSSAMRFCHWTPKHVMLRVADL